MNTTTKNDAQTYAETIAEEVRTLSAVLEMDPDSAGYLPTLAALDLTPETLENHGSDVLSAYLEQYSLDFSLRPDVRGADFGVTAIITRTVGGPSCYITYDSSDTNTVTVEAYWGSDRGRVELWVPGLAEALEELASNH